MRPSARDDLTQLYVYLTEKSGSSRIAIGYTRRIRASWATLLIFPKGGRARDDLRPGVRIFGFERRVVTAYRITEAGDIEIGRVFYGGRDYEALLRDEDGDDPE